MMGAPYTPTRVVGAFNANPTVAPREAAWLSRAGVPDSALKEPTPLRCGYVAWNEPGRFDLAQHTPIGTAAERAILLLVVDDDGDPTDIVAWNPRSRQTACWRGCAWALGQETAFAPRLNETGGIALWRTPLDWLRADRAGLVILRPKVAADLLCDAGPVIAMDLEHGRELRRDLQRNSPRIIIPVEAAVQSEKVAA